MRYHHVLLRHFMSRHAMLSCVALHYSHIIHDITLRGILLL